MLAQYFHLTRYSRKGRFVACLAADHSLGLAIVRRTCTSKRPLLAEFFRGQDEAGRLESRVGKTARVASDNS